MDEMIYYLIDQLMLHHSSSFSFSAPPVKKMNEIIHWQFIQ